jgi:putative intracellular protease/amidase
MNRCPPGTAPTSDEEVVVDGRFISSPKPDDLPAFSAAIIEQLRS